jgi:hypothetical protein
MSTSVASPLGLLDQNTLSQIAQHILTTGLTSSLLGLGGLGPLGVASGPLASLAPAIASPQSVLNNTAVLNQLAAQAKIDGPVTSRLYVSGLDFKVDERQMREVFAVAGHVTGVHLFREKDTHRSRGMATVEYETAFEALNAISMLNKHVLNDRMINVRFDSKIDDDLAKSNGHTGRDAKRSPSGQKSQQLLPVGLKTIGNGIMQPMQSSLLPNPQSLMSQASSGGGGGGGGGFMGQPGFDLTSLASGFGLNPNSLGILIIFKMIRFYFFFFFLDNQVHR